MTLQPKPSLTNAKEQALLIIDRIFTDAVPVPPQDIEFARGLLHESDRGCVLLAAAYVDEALETLLRAKFSANPQVIKRAVDPLLLEGLAPIKSLSARTKLSYALELIDDEIFLAIESIRKLRNEFAHQPAPASLTSEKLTPLIRALPPPQRLFAQAFGSAIGDWLEEIKQAGRASPLIEKITALSRPPSTPERVHFVSAFAYVYGTLQNLCKVSDDT